MIKFFTSKFLSVFFILLANNSFTQVALNFNGITNFVSSNGSPVLNNQSRTVDAWIKTTSTITTQKVICDWGNMTVGQRFTLNLINNRLRIEVGGAGIAGNTPLNTGQWFHVSAVYNSSITLGSNVFLYVNGVLEASGNFAGYPSLSTSTVTGFRIGARIDGINFFEGSVDEVKVYNYARTQAQIVADTLEYCAPQAGLVAYYKLNEGIPNSINTGSTTAIDYSGLGNTGTLNTFSLTGLTSNWVDGRVTQGSASIVSSPNPFICTGSSVSLTTNAVNNFTWSTGNTVSTVIVVSPTTTTNYSITILNPVGCTLTSFLPITVNNALPTTTVVASQNPICTGAATSFSATGASTYTWSGGIINGQAFSPSVTTSYSLIAANGCGVVNSVHTVTVIPLQVTTLASPSLVCQGSSSTLTAAAAAIGFTWSPGSQTGANVVVSPISNTIYTVSGSDGTCTGTQTVLVNTISSPTISITNTVLSICEGQSGTLIAVGAGANGTYSWSPAGATGASISISPTLTSLYTVYGTNSLGCTSSAQIPVLVSFSPVFSVLASNTLVCAGDAATLSANGASNYTWSTGAITASTTVLPLSGLNVYSVTATSTNNTCTATRTIQIDVVSPNVNFSASVSICPGGIATLTASGANTYSWNNVSIGASGQQTYSPSMTNTYTLTANTLSLNLNCLSTHIATIVVNPNPSLTIVASLTNTICKGETNTLTVSGANSYSWNVINSNSAQVIVSPNVTTNYTVLGISSEGCIGNSSIQVKISNCVGFKESENLETLNIFPNPASTEFKIESEIEISLDLFLMNGQFIRAFQIHKGITSIDISDLTKGLYILKGSSESKIFYKKLLIQ